MSEGDGRGDVALAVPFDLVNLFWGLSGFLKTTNSSGPHTSTSTSILAVAVKILSILED